jgi:hypothetical protein
MTSTVEVGDAQRDLQLLDGVVVAPTHLVLAEQQVREELLGEVHGGRTGTPVDQPSAQDRLDQTVAVHVGRQDDLVRVEVVVVRDRTDAVLVDLVLVVDLATVADQDRPRDLLVQHQPHLALEPGDDVEVRDVDDVVTVQLLLLVDRGGSGDPAV